MGAPNRGLTLVQKTLVDDAPAWTEQWQDMPEYTHKDLQPWRTIMMHFRCSEDVQKFVELIRQRVSPTTKFLWYPQAEIDHASHYRHVAAFPKQPQYPVYIVSKGRAESRLTSKALEQMNVPYHIVVEPQEFDEYAKHISPKKILKLPFSNLGQGSIPARNWIWKHAVKSGAARHWILDDNIRGFERFQDNRKIRVADGTIFAIAENYVDRYRNVALAGFNYAMFVVRKDGKVPPIYMNTRIYSCILIRNDLRVRKSQKKILTEVPDSKFYDGNEMEPLQWRGRYNEDTDLSLRVLKDGHCTVLFNAFLAVKIGTQRMRGGNTDQLYQDEGRLRMAESLLEQHPDVVKIITRWGRPQHHVNYKLFMRNKLVRIKDAKTLSAAELGTTLRPYTKK